MKAGGLPLGRRRMGAWAAALAVGPIPLAIPLAGAQPAAPRPGVVLAVPPPCTDRATQLVGLVLEGTGAPAGTVVVFGQAFRPGDLPREASLIVRLADGRSLRSQVDVTVRHPDGSARLAAVSLEAPALAVGGRLGMILEVSRDHPAAGSPALPAAFAGRRAVVEITPPQGPAWQADLIPLLAGQRPWQSGPLASQARVVVPVPPAAVGGATSLRLVADLAVRADGTLWADIWFRNDIAMRPGGSGVRYAARILLDGRDMLPATAIAQPHYTGWGRLLGVARGGASAPAVPLVRPDAAYLADAGAVARYDVSVGVAETLLAQLRAAVTAPAWAVPLGVRGVTQSMGMTGGRPDIGPATQAQAAWLVSGDPRAAAYAIGQAETAGSIPWHFWDETGGQAGSGGWMDAVRWPGLWTDGRGGPPPRGLLQPIPADTGWEPDTAHQPDLAFVPYLLTARRAFLDELQAQAARSVLAHWPADAARGATVDLRRGEGVNLVRGNQVRGAAWSLRQLDEAAWASPDDDPNQAYLRAAAAGNWAWTRAQTARWTALQGEAHGWIPGVYRDAFATPPWQQDHFASTAAAAARRGSEDAKAVLAWMGNFLVGRFLASAKGFHRHDGVAYQMNVAPPATPTVAYKTWAEIGEATRARGNSNLSGWAQSNGNYAQLALLSLAALIDATDTAEARNAFQWLAGAGAPYTQMEDYARDPTSSVMPRGRFRVGGPTARCVGR